MNLNNENYEQNGGQPLSARNVLPVENKDNVCRDYVWGKCTKVQCKFVHECDLQVMLNILHFCHDYQNSTGCKRPNCTFLHATREEEKLFREEGQFPSDLVNRHSQMHAALASMSRKFEDTNKPPPHLLLESQQAPPQMLMVNPMYQTAPRWFLQPPPPPPPREPSPPTPPYTGPPPPVSAPVPAYHSHPMLPPPAGPSAYSQPILPYQLNTSMPPPPAPFLMQQIKNGSIKRLPETHEGSPPKLAASHYTQPIPDAQSVDTSKPPPPLFPTVQQAQNILGKRAHQEGFDPIEAGLSKRKASQPSACENCTRWKLRNLLLDSKLSEKIAEKARAVLKYEEKKNEIANIVDLLCCLALPQSESSNVNDMTLDDTPLRALVANHMKEKPNFVPEQNLNNSMLRRITEILNDSVASASTNTNGNISEDIKRLLDLDLDLHRPEPAFQPPVTVPAPHSFPSSVVSTHAPLPPMPPQFTQAYRPMHHHNYQFPAGLSNSAADSVNKPIASTSAPMQPAPVIPPYSETSYYMMGRPPPPFQ